MDKQIFGEEEIFEAYKRYRLEKPKQFQSKGLGSELYYLNYENAKKNNGVIKAGLRNIIIPPYYKNKMGLWTNDRKQNEEKIKMLWEYNVEAQNPSNIWNQKEADIAKEEMNEKLMIIQKRKLRNMYQKALKQGEPVFNEYNID